MNVSAVTRSGLVRWAALGGVVYVVLFVVGVILFFGNQPDTSSAPARIISFYSDSGHRDRINIGWVVAGLGLFAFLWFVAALRQTIRRLEGDDGFLATLTTIGGVVYASLSLAALAVNTGIKTMSDDTYRHQVYPELIHDAEAVVEAFTLGRGCGERVLGAFIADEHEPGVGQHGKTSPRSPAFPAAALF